MNDQYLLDLLNKFSDAWNAHDVDELLSLVTHDCVFDTSAGPLPYGARHKGTDQLRAAFSSIWIAMPDARWEDCYHVVAGERGFSEWTFRGTRSADGKLVEARGVDLFKFRDGKISYKDTFRKTVIA